VVGALSLSTVSVCITVAALNSDGRLWGYSRWLAGILAVSALALASYMQFGRGLWTDAETLRRAGPWRLKWVMVCLTMIPAILTMRLLLSYWTYWDR